MQPKINVVIEVHEATSFTVHTITGRSGKVYGHAVIDPTRGGAMCLRMTLEEWREAKEDICLSRHKFYPLKWDVEVAEPEPAQPETKKKSAAGK
jgi:hypothetical protein